jgi:hypothetical protein
VPGTVFLGIHRPLPNWGSAVPISAVLGSAVAHLISLAFLKQAKDRSFRKRIYNLNRRIPRSARNDV